MGKRPFVNNAFGMSLCFDKYIDYRKLWIEKNNLMEIYGGQQKYNKNVKTDKSLKFKIKIM